MEEEIIEETDVMEDEMEDETVDVMEDETEDETVDRMVDVEIIVIIKIKMRKN